jgi:cytochrome c554/c'-like protein
VSNPRKSRFPAIFAAMALAGILSGGCKKKPHDATAVPSAAPKSLTIFYTCDTRGHIDPCGCSTGMAGGIARRKTFLDAQRSGPYLLVDAGDVTAGPRAWEVLELEYLLEGYAQMGYHAVNAGHREASLGREGLLKLKAAFTNLLSANLADERGQPVLTPYRIVNLPDGTRAGLLGILDDKASGSEPGKGLKILPPHDAIGRYLPEIKRQAGFIVLLAFADEERMKEIAERFFEINVIVGGKVMQPSAAPLVVNKSLITFITDKGKAVGRLDLQTELSGRMAHTNSIVMLKDDFKDDSAMTKLIAEYKAKLKELDFVPAAHKDDEEGLTLITAERSKDANRYVGAESCRSCHPKAYETWANSKHAHAFHTLEEKGYETNPRCLECHTIGYLASDGYLNAKLTPHLKDVSCESCHGRGDYHVKFYSKQNTGLKNVGFKKVNCVGCHNPDNSAKFELNSYWARIVHGRE